MKLMKTKKFVLDNAKDALAKASEVSDGDYKVDIKPFEGMKIGKDERNKFLVIKEKDVWYLRIC